MNRESPIAVAHVKGQVDRQQGTLAMLDPEWVYGSFDAVVLAACKAHQGSATAIDPLHRSCVENRAQTLR